MRAACLALSIAICTLLLLMAESARAGAPGAVGDLYVTSPGTNEVLQLDGDTGNPLGPFVAAGTGGLGVPTGLAFGPSGNLYVLSQGTDAIGDDAILEFGGWSGRFLGVFHSGLTNLLWEEGGSGELTWGPNGNLFVSNWVDNFGPPTFLPEAVEFDGRDGSIAQIYQSFEVCVWRPHALAIDTTSKLYLSSRNAPWQHIYAYDSATGSCDSLLVGAPFASTSDISDGIEFGPNGNLFASRRYSRDVVEFDGATGALVGTFVSAGSGGLDTPGDLKFGPNRNLFVVNVDGRIFEYHGTDGSFVRVFSNAVIAGAQGDNQGRVRLAFKRSPCDDGLDNEGDGLIDLADPQCANSSGNGEAGLGVGIGGCGIGPELAAVLPALWLARRRRP